MVIIVTRSVLGRICTWVVEPVEDVSIVTVYNDNGDHLRDKERMSWKVLDILLGNEEEIISNCHYT